jgi:hypothetical protein
MSTYPPNLAHSFLTICKITTFKVEEKGFFLYLRDTSVGGQKKPFIEVDMGQGTSKSLFLGELGTCSQNLISTRHMEP